MAAPQPIAPTERIASLDVLRGFALLGILTMNITAGLPGAARLNPLASGGFTGPNFAVWLVGYYLFDEKMITIFSMLFGAGLLIVTERAEKSGLSPTAFFYRRTAILLAIGLAHAYLLWEGDILVTYALCGMLIYPLRRKPARSLIIIAAVLWSVFVPLQIAFAELVNQSRQAEARITQAAAQGTQPNPADKEAAQLWQGMSQGFQPSPAENQKQIQARRKETYLASIVRRAPESLAVHTVLFLVSMLWTVSGRMLLGAALMKLGIFTAARPAAFYLRMALISYAIGLPLVTLAVYLQLHTNFDVVVLFGRTFIINAFASIFVSLGHVALLLWIYKHQWLPSITTRLAAVGRMALTNYLMHSVLCTILFYPYGFGLFGLLDKFQLFGVVLAIWILQLWYSPLWLRHFRFGPAEWLWRSLSYGRRQPLLQRPQMEQQAIA